MSASKEPAASGALDRKGPRLHRLRWGLLVFLAAVGVYAPALRAGFVWDDRQIFSVKASEMLSLRDFYSPTRDDSLVEDAKSHFYP